MVNVAVPPASTCWLSGFFVIEIDGLSTTTIASSLAVTSGPTGGCPVTLATFVNDAVTPAFAQVYIFDSPGARVPITSEHAGDSGSVTVTFVSGVVPVLVTVIVKFAVPPGSTCWSGVFTIVIAGCSTATDSFASLHAPEIGLLFPSPP